jgi:four helix bundle protein
VSIPSNVAEGHGRQSAGEFRQFVGQARGSLLETQVLIAQHLEFVTPQQAEPLLTSTAELGRVLNGLLQSLRR